MQSLWLLAYAVISADFTWRLRKTRYIFLPLFFTVNAVMRIIDIDIPPWFPYLNFVVFLSLGVLLLYQMYINRKVYPLKSYVFLASGILLIIISLKVLTANLTILNHILKLNIWYYLLAAVTGRLITLPQMTYDHSSEKTISTYLFILALIVVVRDLIKNFFV